MNKEIDIKTTANSSNVDLYGIERTFVKKMYKLLRRELQKRCVNCNNVVWGRSVNDRDMIVIVGCTCGDGMCPESEWREALDHAQVDSAKCKIDSYRPVGLDLHILRQLYNDYPLELTFPNIVNKIKVNFGTPNISDFEVNHSLDCLSSDGLISSRRDFLTHVRFSITDRGLTFIKKNMVKNY